MEVVPELLSGTYLLSVWILWAYFRVSDFRPLVNDGVAVMTRDHVVGQMVVRWKWLS